MRELVNNLVSWNWGEIVKAVVSIWVAWVATVALTTWRRQHKAQKQTDFLDQLTESVHEFIYLLAAPIEKVRYVKFGIESHVDYRQVDQQPEKTGAIAYIEKRGEEDGKRLDEYLKPCTQPLSRIRSLVAKGQVLGFRNYKECQNTCAMIAWQYDRIWALRSLIGSASLNWENREVQRHLRDVIALDPDDIEKHLKEQNVKFLIFVEENYRRIFK